MPHQGETTKIIGLLVIKAEIDVLAQSIADQFGGRVATAPIKSRERALEKIVNDYDGDASRIKDLARNTIIVPADQIDSVVSALAHNGANVKRINAATDSLGYSGVNSSLKTKNGITGEIQVNSPEMIYAKETPKNARAILGDDVYDSISAKTGIEGGLGHKLYEQWRALPKGNPGRLPLEAQSKAYYDAIRSKAGQSSANSSNLDLLHQSGKLEIDEFGFYRTPDLGTHSSITELMRSGALPGTKGVTLTDRTIRFGDVYELGTLDGRKVEFALTTERMDGRLVKRLYSGDAWTTPIPKDSRIIGHVHPNETATQIWPSPEDMNVVNARFFRELQANPSAQPKPTRIFWGTGNTENTIFYPGFGKTPK